MTDYERNFVQEQEMKLTAALKAIAETAETVASLETCSERNVLLGLARIARTALAKVQAPHKEAA